MPNFREFTKALTTTPTEILPKRNRHTTIFFNTSAVDILVGIGKANITIPAGDHLAFVNCAPDNALVASTASGTGDMIIWEH